MSNQQRLHELLDAILALADPEDLAIGIGVTFADVAANQMIARSVYRQGLDGSFGEVATRVMPITEAATDRLDEAVAETTVDATVRDSES